MSAKLKIRWSDYYGCYFVGGNYAGQVLKEAIRIKLMILQRDKERK